MEIHRSFILSELTANHFKTYWQDATRWYKQALDYLNGNNYLLSQSWMPYENMLIPMMIFLKELGGGFDRINEKQSEFRRKIYQ